MARLIAKKSTVAAKVPLAADLEIGELAVNTADAKIYTKHSDGNVVGMKAEPLAHTHAIADTPGLQAVLDGKEAAGSAASALSSHVAAGDPHPQYTTAAEAAAAAPVQSVAGKTGAVVLAKADVGLGNVDNTSDAAKPVSTAQLAALNLKANIASPTFTGTVNGITKSMVGLGNADNTSDASKPVSTAQAAAIATATAIHPFLLIGA